MYSYKSNNALVNFRRKRTSLNLNKLLHWLMWKLKRWLWPKFRSSEILFPWLNVTTVKSHLVYAFRKVTRSWDESFPVWGPPGERALMFSCSLNRSRFFLDPQNCLICSPKLNFAKFTCFRLCLPNGIKSLIHVTHSPPPQLFCKDRNWFPDLSTVASKLRHPNSLR